MLVTPSSVAFCMTKIMRCRASTEQASVMSMVGSGERSIRLRPVLDVRDDIIAESLTIMDQACHQLPG